MSDRLTGAKATLEYQKDVDQALTDLCGVTYTELTEMAPNLDHNRSLLTASAARGVSSNDFARAFQRAHKLELVSSLGAELASSFNRFRAAIVAFATEARGWRLGTDGRAYRAADGGKVLFLDIHNKNGELGFAVGEAEYAQPFSVDKSSVDMFGRVHPAKGDVQTLAVRFDIGDAITDAMRNRAELRKAAENEIDEDEILDGPRVPSFA